MPESAGVAMGFQKSSEQLEIIVGPSLAGATIAALGVDAAVIGAGIVMVVGSLFLFWVKEPSVRGERVTCGDRSPKGGCCSERKL